MRTRKMRPILLLMPILLAADASYIRNTRRAIPQELYRDNVEPSKGGKVPEAAHMRIELNKLDAAGLESGEGLEMMEELVKSDIVLPERAGSAYNPGKLSQTKSFFSGSEFSSSFPFNPPFDSLKNPVGSPQLSSPFDEYNPIFEDDFSNDYDYSAGYSPPLKLKPDYVPEPPSSDPYTYAPAKPAYSSPPAYAPVDPYAPTTVYDPAPYAPEPYSPPEPVYQKPVGPVLLEKRPYEVKSVQPLPITVAESYTNFDCRNVPYPDRHYADPEAGCEIYHFCHADGKQDTFQCGYGTVFNEYLGTCDYKNNVHCGEQLAAVPVHAVHSPSPYHDPAYQSFGAF